MGIFNSLFKSKPSNPEEAQQRTEQRQFETLRDNGVRAMQANQLQLAIPYLEKALELRPDDRPTMAYMAEAQLRGQNHAAALPLLRQLAPGETDGIELHLLLAQSEGRTGDFASMQQTMQPLLATHADDARVPFLAAVAAHGLHDDLTAIALATQALTGHEDYTRARLFRARVLGEMGQWREALEDTTVLVNDSATADEEAVLLHGDAQAATGDADAAERTYRAVLEQDPFCREAFLSLERLYEQNDLWDKALAVCDEAIEAIADFAEAYKVRGGVKLHLHDEAGAADDLKRALEKKPELAQAVDGEFSNIEAQMNERYKAMNPYKF